MPAGYEPAVSTKIRISIRLTTGRASIENRGSARFIYPKPDKISNGINIFVVNNKKRKLCY